MSVALFVGRFQPFHKGHEHAVKALLGRHEKVVICIGSANQNDEKNPFSLEQRKYMISLCLSGFKNYEIIEIPDFDDDDEWVDHIIKKVHFDIVITGNPWVQNCFVGVKPIKDPDFLEPEKYNSTNIRQLMNEGKDWSELVPKPVYEYIKNMGV